MQSNDKIEVVAPLGDRLSEVALLSGGVAVLGGTACVLDEPGRIFFAAGGPLASPENDVALFVETIEIPVIGGDGQVSGVLCRNLSPSGTSAAAAQGDDMAMAEEAAKSILHDITNLLATIDCGLRLLGRQAEVDDRQLILERMRHSVQRVAMSSRRLLEGNWSRQEPHPDITTRQDLVAAVEDLWHAIGPGRTLHYEIAQDLSDFAADPGDLYFALLNLCRNASAALQYDGVVVISARNSVPRPGVSPGVVEITVADNGGGMTEAVLRQAFDTNFTTKPAGQGSGLGFSQVRQFVQASGGAIEIKSEVGLGTAVRLMLLPVSSASDGGHADLSN